MSGRHESPTSFLLRESAFKALNASHVVLDRRLGVLKRTVKKDENHSKTGHNSLPQAKECPPKSPSNERPNIEKALENAAKLSLNAQIDVLAEKVVLSDEDRQQRRALLQNLEKALTRGLKRSPVRVVPFGSTSSGLGLRGCDMDVLVEFSKRKSALNR